MRITLVLPPGATLATEGTGLLPLANRLGRAPADVLCCAPEASTAVSAARAWAALAGEPGQQLVLLPSGTEGEALAAGIAALAGGISLGRCAEVALESGAVLATRLAFGGRCALNLRSQAHVTCATLRPANGDAIVPTPNRVLQLPAGDEPAPKREPVPAASAYPRVEGAPIVVAGGRGMDGPEGFALLARLATALGAGLAGSLPAVDAGWVPVAHQVGQSGKFVAPRLYFAVGISGTPQHMAGIAGHTRVIALNREPDAPIFGRAVAGAVGDWRNVLPLLLDALAARPADMAADEASPPPA